MKKYLFLILFINTLIAQDSTVIQLIGDSYTRQDFAKGFQPYLKHAFDTSGYLVKFVGQYNVQDNGTNYFGGNPPTNYLDFDVPITFRYTSAKTSKQAKQWITGVGSDSTTISTVITNYPCDVVGIYIGLNDIANGSMTTATTAAYIDTMLIRTWAIDSNKRIVLCNLAKTQNTAYHDSINALNAKVATLVTSKLAQGKLIWLCDVDAQMNETTDFFSDSHPSSSYGATRNTLGYYHLAMAIYGTMKQAVDYVPPSQNRLLTAFHLTSWDLNMTGITGGAGASNYGNTPYSAVPTNVDYVNMFTTNLDTAGNMNVTTAWDGRQAWGGTDFLYQRRVPFLNWYRAQGGKRVLCVIFGALGYNTSTGYWNKFKIMIDNPTYRTNAVVTIRDSIILGAKYDGVTFDIEPVVVADTANFRSFISELRDTLNNYHQWYDTTATPWIHTSMIQLPNYWASMHQYFDHLEIQSYDLFSSTYPQRTWANSPVLSAGAEDTVGNPLPSVESKTSSYIDAGIPASKMMMGMSVNGYFWKGGRKKGSSTIAPNDVMDEWQSAPTRTPFSETRYYNLKRLWIDTHPSQYKYDSARFTPYLKIDSTNADVAQYVTYEDTTTIQKIIQIADTLRGRVAGVYLWEFNGGYLNSTLYPSVTNRMPFYTAMINQIEALDDTNVVRSANADSSMLLPITVSVAGDGVNTVLLTVTVNDSVGNPILHGGATVAITKTTGLGRISSVTDVGDGTYTATVTSPRCTGSGTFVATINGNNVENQTGSQTVVTLTYTKANVTTNWKIP